MNDEIIKTNSDLIINPSIEDKYLDAQIEIGKQSAFTKIQIAKDVADVIVSWVDSVIDAQKLENNAKAYWEKIHAEIAILEAQTKKDLEIEGSVLKREEERTKQIKLFTDILSLKGDRLDNIALEAIRIALENITKRQI